MEATGISHIAICVRDMERSLAFYRDQLGMTVTIDHDTDPTEGGRAHNYKRQRKTRRRVSIGYQGNNVPALTLTSHPGESPDGDAIQLDQVGITHLAFTMPGLKAFTETLLAKGGRTCRAPGSIFRFPGERQKHLRERPGRDSHPVQLRWRRLTTPAGKPFAVAAAIPVCYP